MSIKKEKKNLNSYGLTILDIDKLYQLCTSVENIQVGAFFFLLMFNSSIFVFRIKTNSYKIYY